MLHRALDGTGPIPFAHYLGRLSEEFGGALPSVIWAEQQRLPVGFLEEIIECRRYAEAYVANQRDPSTWQTSAMRIRAKAIEHALAAEEMESNARE